MAPSVTQQLYENVVLQSKKITFPVFGWPHQIFFRNFNFFFFIKLSGFKGQNAQYFAVAKKIEKFFNFKFFSNYSHGGVFGSVSHSTVSKNVVCSQKKHFPVFGWPHRIFFRNFNFFFSSNYQDLRSKRQYLAFLKKITKLFTFKFFSNYSHKVVFGSVSHSTVSKNVVCSQKKHFPVFGWPHRIFLEISIFFFHQIIRI